MKVASVCLLLALTAGGCSTGNAQAIVTRPLESDLHSGSLKLVEDTRGATVPEAQRQVFQNMLSERLFNSGAFARGEDLTLRYSFMEYEPGSRTGRLLFGVTDANSEANLIVKCEYLDKAGKELSTVQVSSRLTGGLLKLGGSTNDALGRAADKVKEYTVSHFAASAAATQPAR